MRQPLLRTGLSRRHVLMGAAALGLSAGRVHAKARTDDYDVVVIGAGMSGLTAAITLRDAGARVKILEGSGRIGGRVLTLDDVEGRPEGGGTEVPAMAARVRAMIQRVGLGITQSDNPAEPFGIYVDGHYVPKGEWQDSPHNPLTGDWRRLTPFQLEGRFMAMPNPLGASLNSWMDPAFAQYDISYADYLKSLGADDAILSYILRNHDVETLDQLSALWALRRDASRDLSHATGASGLDVLDKGMARLPEAMAELAGDIEFHRHVVGVRQQGAHVGVVCADGRSYIARHVVCTTPPTLARTIAFDPALPPAHARAVAETPLGQGTSVVIPVRERFWELDGRPPGLWTDDDRLGRVMLRNSTAGSALWVYVTGPSNRAFRTASDEAIRSAVVQRLTELRPSVEGRLGRAAVVNWSSAPFTRGTLWRATPGQMSQFGQVLATPAGQISFAGEHTALLSAGLEGAMESGERAARDILKTL